MRNVPTSVCVLGASKTNPPEAIRRAFEAGITHFGENYLQEAIPKIDALKDLKITWHFIGAIQSRKAKDIAKYFDWVQTVDRESVAQKLNEAAAMLNKTLQVCIQLNIDNEPQKAGVTPQDLLPLADIIEKLPHLTLRGLMVIPKPKGTEAESQNCFSVVKTHFDTLAAQHPSCDTLSMGMSKDYRLAIAQGSTMVRLGTHIFGARNYN